jgi:hypothetical protein
MATHFTNKHNLPESFVRAVKVDRHITRGDISVTTLIDAPQIRQLKRKYDVVEDVSDRVWALMGTAVHHVLELADVANHSARTLIEASAVLSEIAKQSGDVKLEAASRYLTDLAKSRFPEAFNDDIVTEAVLSVEFDGMILSGTFDRLVKNKKLLEDYKNTSVWSYMYDEGVEKWEKQLNIYRYMIKKVLGVDIDTINVIGIFRDWSEAEMKRSQQNYPKAPVMRVNVRVWSYDETEEYIMNRIRLHAAADLGVITECTGKERWSSTDTYKVTTSGRKRSIKNFPSKAMADRFIEENQFKEPGMFVVTVPGESRRCDKWCPVRDVCPQNKKRLEEIANQSE